jgi:hypothetical protein
MTTGPKKGLYYYIVLGFSVIGFFIMVYSFHYIKTAYVNGTFFTDILGTVYALTSIMAEFVLISEVLKHKQGYTTIVTTKYNLYKCRAIGEEKTFMMFADNEEELELFFAITQPDKKYFTEPAEMSGNSIKMKVFNGDQLNE